MERKNRDPFTLNTIRDVMVENGWKFDLALAHEIYDRIMAQKSWRIRDIENILIEKRNSK